MKPQYLQAFLGGYLQVGLIYASFLEGEGLYSKAFSVRWGYQPRKQRMQCSVEDTDHASKVVVGKPHSIFASFIGWEGDGLLINFGDGF